MGEPLDDSVADLAELTDLLVGDGVEERALHALDVTRRGIAEGSEAGVGEHRQLHATITLVTPPGHPAEPLHAGDGV